MSCSGNAKREIDIIYHQGLYPPVYNNLVAPSSYLFPAFLLLCNVRASMSCIMHHVSLFIFSSEKPSFELSTPCNPPCARDAVPTSIQFDLSLWKGS